MERMMNKLRRDECGQIAVLMVLTIPVILMAMGLALDTGIWLF